jgi:hypothetical protein
MSTETQGSLLAALEVFSAAAREPAVEDLLILGL